MDEYDRKNDKVIDWFNSSWENVLYIGLWLKVEVIQEMIPILLEELEFRKRSYAIFSPPPK